MGGRISIPEFSLLAWTTYMYLAKKGGCLNSLSTSSEMNLVRHMSLEIKLEAYYHITSPRASVLPSALFDGNFRHSHLAVPFYRARKDLWYQMDYSSVFVKFNLIKGVNACSGIVGLHLKPYFTSSLKDEL